MRGEVVMVVVGGGDPAGDFKCMFFLVVWSLM
jgi:hypothetical protein